MNDDDGGGGGDDDDDDDDDDDGWRLVPKIAVGTCTFPWLVPDRLHTLLFLLLL